MKIKIFKTLPSARKYFKLEILTIVIKVFICPISNMTTYTLIIFDLRYIYNFVYYNTKDNSGRR